jgi:hypothetical protein
MADHDIVVVGASAGGVEALESIWASLGGAVAVLDPELRFLNLDIGLPVDQVRPILRATLNGQRDRAATVVGATNRRGKRIRCRVTCSPLLGSDQVIRGVIVLVEEERRSADGKADGAPASQIGDGSGRDGD